MAHRLLLFLLASLAGSAAGNSCACPVSRDSGSDAERIEGMVTFSDVAGGVRVDVRLSGFNVTAAAAGRGFHVHAVGSTGSACSDATGHFNPHAAQHGDRLDPVRHVGDLGNIFVSANGSVSASFVDKMIDISNPSATNFIGNRTVVIHGGADDLGKGGDAGSLKTGNAGARVGCCIIGCLRLPTPVPINASPRSAPPLGAVLTVTLAVTRLAL